MALTLSLTADHPADLPETLPPLLALIDPALGEKIAGKLEPLREVEFAENHLRLRVAGGREVKLDIVVGPPG